MFDCVQVTRLMYELVDDETAEVSDMDFESEEGEGSDMAEGRATPSSSSAGDGEPAPADTAHQDSKAAPVATAVRGTPGSGGAGDQEPTGSATTPALGQGRQPAARRLQAAAVAVDLTLVEGQAPPARAAGSLKQSLLSPPRLTIPQKPAPSSAAPKHRQTDIRQLFRKT